MQLALVIGLLVLFVAGLGARSYKEFWKDEAPLDSRARRVRQTGIIVSASAAGLVWFGLRAFAPPHYVRTHVRVFVVLFGVPFYGLLLFLFTPGLSRLIARANSRLREDTDR